MNTVSAYGDQLTGQIIRNRFIIYRNEMYVWRILGSTFKRKRTFYLQLSFTLLCPILINDLTGVNPRIWSHCWLDRHYKSAIFSLTYDVTWVCFHCNPVPQPTRKQNEGSNCLKEKAITHPPQFYVIRENQAHTFKYTGSIMGGIQYFSHDWQYYVQHLAQPIFLYSKERYFNSILYCTYSQQIAEKNSDSCTPLDHRRHFCVICSHF